MKDWAADKIERRKVDDLIPYARNARTHSDEQVAQLAASIKEWGWTTPVLIDEDGEIIAAEKNGRHSRLMELDPKYCDVIVKRWCEFTGKDATLEANGKSFSVLEKGLEADAA